jgi:hypothetical protein
MKPSNIRFNPFSRSTDVTVAGPSAGNIFHDYSLGVTEMLLASSGHLYCGFLQVDNLDGTPYT